MGWRGATSQLAACFVPAFLLWPVCYDALLWCLLAVHLWYKLHCLSRSCVSATMRTDTTVSCEFLYPNVIRTKTFTERPEVRGSGGMGPPFRALRLPSYLLWWAYVFLLAFSPLPAFTQETDKNGYLPDGCRWDELALELNCSSLGLTRVPYIHPNVSGIMKQL